MDKILNVRMRQRRDTQENWEKNNPILLNGEIALVDTVSGELRMKIGDGANRYSALPFNDDALRLLIDTKQDREDGKGLSTNDYTTEDMTKLNNIESGAEQNVIENIKSTTLNISTIEDKTIALDVQWMEFS